MKKWSQAIEDYLKQIYLLGEGGAVATGQEIAARLGVSQPSVTAMLKRLQELGLIEYEPYRGAEVTDAGRTIALEVIRHHRLIEAYLADVLGMPWEDVHAEAEVLEHHISERMEALMAEKLGHPEFDPHGHPIPGVDGALPVRTDAVRCLSSVSVGEQATVRTVRNEHRELLQFLHQIGVVPERRLTVHSRGPLGDTVTIVNQEGSIHAIGREIAECIDVS